ncbi:MAG: UvrD-helicase domain-containing protein, partial [Myxococcota bacterium]
MRLNPAQQRAVDHNHGPLLVLAGAGSGKTGVVTQRIARLIREGIPARAILAVTFTNKAATEMQERVARLAGAKATKGILLCTFHRFGLEVLSRETKALGFRGKRFAIFDRGDCTGIIREHLRRVTSDRNFDIGAVINRISLAKNAFIDPPAFEAYAAKSDDPYDEITAMVYGEYINSLRSLQAFDFDDLVCEPVRLWRQRPDVLGKWQQRFRFVIVDEYQDTNVAQFELLRLLVSEHKNICVVGDDDQAIYAWRGADVRNILDFPKHFAGAVSVRLEHNYRSRKPVLDVANAVLQSSQAPRHDKQLIVTRGDGPPVKLVVAKDGSEEARFVADECHRLVESAVKPKNIAVLYRSNLQAGEIEGELRARGIPYQVLGGTQTFERKEVKDILAYLQAALDGDNELAVRRSLNYPPRGIGDAALGRLSTFATIHDTSLMAAIEKSHAVPGLTQAARDGCRTYLRAVNELRRNIEGPMGPGDIIKGLASTIELKAQIAAESGQNAKAAARRLTNITYLIKSLERRHAKEPLTANGWRTFLRMLMLREEGSEEETANKVTLTTMHGSKGLEFPYVFLVGLEEGLMPHTRTLEERSTDTHGFDGRPVDEIEQERRLFYVAVTRAREQLYLCRAAHRPARGKMMKRAPSR